MSKEDRAEREEKMYWLFFNLIKNLGPQKFNIILAYFKSLKAAYQAGYLEFKKAGIDNKTIYQIFKKKEEVNLEDEWKKLAREKIGIKTLKDNLYPKLLKEIHSPPPIIYYQGKFIQADEFLVSVVGTRKPSAYGRQATHKIVKALAEQKITIVSGLAFGVDALAHQACLEVKGGRTIAVLGSGLDQVSPATNLHLAKKIIAADGLIISEFPLTTLPLKHNFPQRNRIISGLSLGTLIIEAPMKSGALITARFALEQNREVFSLPGSIYSKNSYGTNNLIKMGARPVTDFLDILETLNLRNVPNLKDNLEIFPDSKEEEIILKILSDEPVHIDKIIEGSKLEASIINSTLTYMEMKGKVKNIGGQQFILAR